MVKGESLVTEAAAADSTSKKDDEDVKQVSHPMLVFVNEQDLRKSAKRNGWVTRSSSKEEGTIRFCCGFSESTEKTTSQSKCNPKCSLVRIAKRVSDDADGDNGYWKLKGTFAHPCQPVPAKDTSGTEGFHDKIGTLDTKVY